MGDYRPIDLQLIDVCQQYPPDFEQIRQLLLQGADVNAVSANDPDESVMSHVICSYPQAPGSQRACGECKEIHCNECGLYVPNADGKYLPQMIQFFLEHGFDVTQRDGLSGALALQSLIFAFSDPYILDACKLLLRAGADPSLCLYDESVLSAVAGEASFRASEGDHRRENLYETMYRIMEAKINGQDYWNIHYYPLCIGRRINSIFLCSDRNPCKGIFFTGFSGLRHRNCFQGSVVLDCEGYPLCVSHCADLVVDPNIPQYARSRYNLASYFPHCLGHIITDIGFEHTSIQKDHFRYGQPIILIRLDHGRVLRFSVNYGEVPSEKMAGWFKIDRT